MRNFYRGKYMSKVQVITGVERRRRFTDGEKLEILREAYQGGESVSAVARRHQVSSSLIHSWRKKFLPPPTLADHSAPAAPFARLRIPEEVAPMGESPIRIHWEEQCVIELPPHYCHMQIASLVSALRAQYAGA